MVVFPRSSFDFNHISPSLPEFDTRILRAQVVFIRFILGRDDKNIRGEFLPTVKLKGNH